mmetsp:Transcript_3293/g.5170  ORF Transcript_3293/g.5170 Transcript_3293/m.5170 type:complete len:485 (-) Transcript_3293:107-1561(-)
MNDSERLLLNNQHDALSNQYSSTVAAAAHSEEGYVNHAGNDQNEGDKPSVSIFRIIAILSGAFTYGGVMSTYFLLTLPIECSVFGDESSLFLGLFVGLAGLSQLVSPVIGMYSDRCTHSLGRRRPYVIFGGVLGIVSLLVQQSLSSDIDGTLEGWYAYVIAFFLTMCSMNIIFAAMIALIPDLVPKHQTGTANGVEALMFVSGSLFAFGSFNAWLDEDLTEMYSLYICLTAGCVVLTYLYANEIPLSIDSEQSAANKPITWNDFKDSFWISPTEHHDFFYVTLSRTFYYMGGSVQAFFLYYLRDVIHVDDPEGSVSLLAVLGQGFGAFMTVPVGILSDYLGNGRKPYVFTSCFVLSVCNFLLLFSREFHEVMIIASVAGMANGAYLTMDTSLAMDTLPSSEESARLLGVWGVAMFIGSSIGPLIGGPLLFLSADNDESDKDDGDSSYAIYGYAILFSLSSLYYFCSAWILTFVRRESGVVCCFI